jgi:hypothetical protein
MSFKRWFKNSKVVRNGKPLICYHGTPHQFTSFSVNHHGKHDAGYLGVGFYFTALPRIASIYSSKTSNGQVMPVFLSIQKPLILTRANMDQEIGYVRVANISMELQARGVPYEKAMIKAAQEYRKELEKAGYDGIIDDTTNDMSQIVAFYPTQIKSAIGNNGNYDPRDPDITH